MMNSFSHDENSIFSAQQVLENRGRVAIFVDGSNLFYAALQLNIEIDYTKLLAKLTGGSRLLRSFFYTGVDRTNEKQQGFLLWMRRNGYRVIAKDLSNRWLDRSHVERAKQAFVVIGPRGAENGSDRPPRIIGSDVETRKILVTVHRG